MAIEKRTSCCIYDTENDKVYEEFSDITVHTTNDNMFSGCLEDIGDKDITIQICERGSGMYIEVAIDDIEIVSEYCR